MSDTRSRVTSAFASGFLRTGGLGRRGSNCVCYWLILLKKSRQNSGAAIIEPAARRV